MSVARRIRRTVRRLHTWEWPAGGASDAWLTAFAERVMGVNRRPAERYQAVYSPAGIIGDLGGDLMHETSRPPSRLQIREATTSLEKFRETNPELCLKIGPR